ncbi:MAG: sigma 54-interacting transcriptional regulator [Myxococcales bacterium]|nr:sigma 54-interacting transcriptional regulator [Myxococcales bacterium]
MRAERSDTQDATTPGRAGDEAGRPGLLQVWSDAGALSRGLPVGAGVVLGRCSSPALALDDARISREHCAVAHDGASWSIRDLDSRNGTFVDGARSRGEALRIGPRTLRIGHCVLLPLAHLRGDVALEDGVVVGPRLRAARSEIAAAAALGRALLVTGGTGSGKELAARHFHRGGPTAAGPFVPVNCAAIPRELAERLLFGTVRGAYSGATAAAEGYVQAADGGVLFLDEIGELDLDIQAKLLRFLETGEVYAIGATRPRRVDVRVCLATHRDLRAMVQARRFREDFYFRIAQPHVALPPLCERPEEVPWHVERAIAGLDAGLRAHALLVEGCLLRPWPGNVRELRAAVQAAALRARKSGRERVELDDLAADVGRAIDDPQDGTIVAADHLADRQQVLAALRAEGGNVARSARTLGVHRNQLRRWLAQQSIDPQAPPES